MVWPNHNIHFGLHVLKCPSGIDFSIPNMLSNYVTNSHRWLQVTIMKLWFCETNTSTRKWSIETILGWCKSMVHTDHTVGCIHWRLKRHIWVCWQLGPADSSQMAPKVRQGWPWDGRTQEQGVCVENYTMRYKRYVWLCIKYYIKPSTTITVLCNKNCSSILQESGQKYHACRY
jgi:hypothetical protein